MKKYKLFVDADSIIFAGAVVAEVAEVPMFKKDNVMKKIIRNQMNDLDNVFPFAEVSVAIRGSGNFRKALYPQYKANRPKHSDLLYALLEEGGDYMMKYWDTKEANGMEADDLVSIWNTAAQEDEDVVGVVVGIDKDLLQIPGNHYNFKKKTKTVIDEDTGHYNLMMQCITGDSGDNIPGIKGIGPKKAEGILRSVPMERRWNAVKAAWLEHKAGDPMLSYHLLKMMASWDEYQEIRKVVMEKNTAEFN